MIKLTDEDYSNICNKVDEIISEYDYYNEEIEDDAISVEEMHAIVENALLELFPTVGQAYQQYRNYKLDFVKCWMMYTRRVKR